MAGNNISTRDEKGSFVQKYDWDALIPDILVRIREGESVREICNEDEGMPTAGAFVAQVRYVDPDKWQIAYEQAMQARADHYGFKLEATYEDLLTGDLDHNSARVAAQILQVRMGQLAPRRYNDKVIHQTINHTVDVSIRDRMTRREIEPPTIDGQAEEVA